MRNNDPASIVLLILVACSCFSPSSYAENARLVLRRQELTWLSCEPNENINEVIEKLGRNNKIELDSMEDIGINEYVAGDPTPRMAWIFSIAKNRQDQLIGMEYDRFKESEGGVRLVTSRGVKYGSNIASVYKAYGSNPKVSYQRDPPMNYVRLKYPFIIEETGQTGNLRFTLKYEPKKSEETATVIRMMWRLTKRLEGRRPGLR